ncbi:hypothetical protein [Qipengyuania nanhaisediminis]|uniref:hypothetical protein n=1 Tax=Qipengyuania nanhaisediminis TaxID=604088 RepID=UPI0038B36F76
MLIDWQPHLSLGITGHRAGHAGFASHRDRIDAALGSLFSDIEAQLDALDMARSPVRLHSLLASGADQLAAHRALALGWELVAPLPFGEGLNLAINSGARTREDVEALIEGGEAHDPHTASEARAIRDLTDRARVFAIADRDEAIAAALAASLGDERDPVAERRLAALQSDNVALAGRVMLERTDLLVAIWDGRDWDMAGGTGHTIAAALEQGTPVIAMAPGDSGKWTILTRPQELARAYGAHARPCDEAALTGLVVTAMAPQRNDLKAVSRERFRPRATFGFGIYRRLETLFGGRNTRSGTTKAVYEAPDAIAQGSAAPLVKAIEARLAPGDDMARAIRDRLVPLFAWADGVSGRLSDAYRSGMSVNFALSAFAIIAGIAYLPFGLADHKWAFAAVELGLLVAIVAITFAGNRRAWHRRWFETRRVAEYLRFAPAMLLMGVARPIGRWPRGDTRQWPERFARDAIRDAGLPAARLDKAYLDGVLRTVVLPHVTGQRRYHEAKAAQLDTVHHRIDRAAEYFFLAALVSVTIYLGVELAALLGLLAPGAPYAIAKSFTFLGVAFPTIGANLAGIRYFGDFERFAGISRATAAKLREVEARLNLLVEGEQEGLTYRSASDIVRMVDEVVFSEIESWQAVYGGKALALPA